MCERDNGNKWTRWTRWAPSSIPNSFHFYSSFHIQFIRVGFEFQPPGGGAKRYPEDLGLTFALRSSWSINSISGSAGSLAVVFSWVAALWGPPPWFAARPWESKMCASWVQKSWCSSNIPCHTNEKVSRVHTMSSSTLPREMQREKLQNKENQGPMRWRPSHRLRRHC